MPCCRICSEMWVWRTREARRASQARRIPFRLVTENSWISWWRLWTPRIHISFAVLSRTRSRREVCWMLTWYFTSSTVTVCWKVGYVSVNTPFYFMLFDSFFFLWEFFMASNKMKKAQWGFSFKNLKYIF